VEAVLQIKVVAFLALVLWLTSREPSVAQTEAELKIGLVDQFGSPRQQLDAIMLKISRDSSGCSEADKYVNHAEDMGSDGYFHPIVSAERYGIAALEFGKCSVRESSAVRRARFTLYAAIADDQAAIRYKSGNEPDVAYAAGLAAGEELRLARKGLGSAPPPLLELFARAIRVIGN